MYWQCVLWIKKNKKITYLFTSNIIMFLLFFCSKLSSREFLLSFIFLFQPSIIVKTFYKKKKIRIKKEYKNKKIIKTCWFCFLWILHDPLHNILRLTLNECQYKQAYIIYEMFYMEYFFNVMMNFNILMQALSYYIIKHYGNKP